MKMITERLKVTTDRQKSYADMRRGASRDLGSRSERVVEKTNPIGKSVVEKP